MSGRTVRTTWTLGLRWAATGEATIMAGGVQKPVDMVFAQMDHVVALFLQARTYWPASHGIRQDYEERKKKSSKGTSDDDVF